MNWTTKMSEVAPEMLTARRVAEMHTAFFVPADYPGKGTMVSLGIPECELIVCLLQPDGEVVSLVNRPKTNFSVKNWIKLACREATAARAALSFNCDTLKQLEQVVALAQNLLPPQYERVALERMKNSESRTRVGLS
jgi:hypothetical protein